MPATRPHIALIIETSKAFGRGVLRGIARYVHTQTAWSIYVDERALDAAPPRWLDTWHGDGIIARSLDRRTMQMARDSGAAVIDLLTDPHGGPPLISANQQSIGRLAATHLRDRGFQNFGYFGLPTGHWSAARRSGFVDAVQQHGFSCDSLELPCEVAEVGFKRRRNWTWEREQDTIAEWVRKLPKSVGVMASYDVIGLRLLDACRRADISVPEEVAVISVDDDELLCSLADPPMSSIQQNSPQIGFEAAALLDRLMSGEAAPSEPTLVEPLGVTLRQSTDVMAIPDAGVATALRFIHQNGCSGIRVTDVVARTNLSRRGLERRFAQFLGRSPHEEILRVKFERAKQLLIETDLSQEDIAYRAGFTGAPYMCVLFKKRFGNTPGAFRATAQASTTRFSG